MAKPPSLRDFTRIGQSRDLNDVSSVTLRGGTAGAAIASIVGEADGSEFRERAVMTAITTCDDERDQDAGATTPTAFLLFDSPIPPTSADAIRVASCRQFETIVVKTRWSVYEFVVLDGRTGDILVRGGSAFPEFRPALFVGSTAGGRALKMNTIDIGLRMEFHVGEGTVVTSPVTAVLRTPQHGHQPSVG